MRVSWDQYFMSLADMAAKRSTCPRASVGAVVVKNKRVIGTGYNGSPRGLPHCDTCGCVMVDDHCVRSVHAEANAILQALNLMDTANAAIYCTHLPCHDCSKLIINAGITSVKYKNEYFDEKFLFYPNIKDQLDLFMSANVEIEKIEKEVAH